MSTEPGAGAQPNQSEPIDILTGGGDMGRLARALDWSRTPVGAPATWPQSLRTALSILLESKFPMLLCWGPDFTQFYNDPFRPILGLNKHPALGKSTRETFAEAWHIIGPLFDQVMRGHAVGFEDMLVPLDRSGFLEECYFVYSYSPIRVESGGVGGVLVTCTETSGRVIAERRLRMLGELSAQAARANDAPTAWTCAAPVLASNPSDLPFFLLYALESDGRAARVVSQSPAAPGPPVIVADDPNPAWPIFGANASQGPAFVSDVRRRFGDHAGLMWPDPIVTAVILPITRPGLPQPYGFLVAAVSPRLALDDKYREFLVLVADQIATAVANARAHEEERQRTEALIELDRQKTAFFSNVSHEFRTPLTLLLGPLEDALSRGPRTLATSELELVHRNALRLLRLVNTLLDFSRIEAGRAQPKFEETDLAGLTRDIASTFQSVMDHAGLDYAIDVPASVPASIDVAMWEKVLLNLLSNAFKFTLRGGVRVQLRESPQGITLSVQDTGSGIPASEAPHVFDRFHRVGGTPARTFEGSGIGLALVRELVRMHGGDIAVESVEGQGSTFTVTMPVRPIPSVQIAPTLFSPPVEAAAPFLEEARRWIGTPTPGPEDGGHHAAVLPADHGPARILVVDDNADMREYLQRLLAGTWTIDARRQRTRGTRTVGDRHAGSHPGGRHDAGAGRAGAASRSARPPRPRGHTGHPVIRAVGRGVPRGRADCRSGRLHRETVLGARADRPRPHPDRGLPSAPGNRHAERAPADADPGGAGRDCGGTRAGPRLRTRQRALFRNRRPARHHRPAGARGAPRAGRPGHLEPVRSCLCDGRSVRRS
jgi:signal transduction histidine kinase